jgi:hypothetical protein
MPVGKSTNRPSAKVDQSELQSAHSVQLEENLDTTGDHFPFHILRGRSGRPRVPPVPVPLPLPQLGTRVAEQLDRAKRSSVFQRKPLHHFKSSLTFSGTTVHSRVQKELQCPSCLPTTSVSMNQKVVSKHPDLHCRIPRLISQNTSMAFVRVTLACLHQLQTAVKHS